MGSVFMDKATVDLLAYGYCSNAGDVLIYEAIKSLFERDINFKYRHVRLDKMVKTTQNIVIGSGGLISGSYDPINKPDEWIIRHITEDKICEWEQLKKNIFFFGTGTNTPHLPTKGEKPFSPISRDIIRRLIKLSSKVYLRGSYDIFSISKLADSEDLHKFKFQPCPSMFIRNFAKKEKAKVDVIALNLPFSRMLNEDNYKNHPIRKFVSYAASLGLKVKLVPNHPDDVSKFMYEIFDEIDLPEQFCDLIHDDSKGDARNKAIAFFTDHFTEHECIFSRFSGYRFALG